MLLVLRLLLLGQAASREECLLALLPRDTIRHIFGFALLATLPRHAVFSPHAPWRNVLATHPQAGSFLDALVTVSAHLVAAVPAVPAHTCARECGCVCLSLR